jgi:hypothetical protein
MRSTHRIQTLGGRLTAVLVAVLVVTSVFGPIGVASAQTAAGVSVSHANSQTTVAPGETVTVTATFDQTAANSPTMEPVLPSGWTVTGATAGANWSWFPNQQTFLGNLVLSDGDGVTGTYTHTYTVQVPSDASPGDYTITSEGSVLDPPTGDRLVNTASTTVTVEDTSNTAPSIDAIDDQSVVSGENVNVSVSASDADGDTVSLSLGQAPGFVTLAGGNVVIDPGAGDVGSYTVEVVADDGNATTTESFQLTVDAATSVTAGTVLERVNAGGSTITATDGGPDWTGVTGTSTDGPLVSTSGSNGNYNNGDDVTAGSEVPSSTPSAVYDAERYGEMTWEFDATSGSEVEVRLYLSNQFPQASTEGDRQYNVAVEGDQVLTEYDPVQDVGHATGTVKTFTVTEDGDGNVTVTFTPGAAENPQVNAIEVVDVSAANTPPTVDAIADQTVTEGDSVTLPVTASDDDGDSVSLSLGQAPDFVTLSNGEITVAPQTGDAANSPYTVEVTADDGTDTTTETFTVTVEEPTPTVGSALVEILPDAGSVDASTYGGGTYQVTNTGEKNISSVSFDLSTTSLPDMVFDPAGTAGDPTGEGLNIVSDGGTGITTAGGGSAEAFSQPHNGVDNSDGYDVMTVEFSDFQSGETATFWADNDPTSIKGATVGSQEAGPVSGLELARATVTVTYEDGTTQTTQLMGDGSNGGATAVVTGDEAPAPTIGAQGVPLDGSVLDGYHSGATVPATDQTITVTGQPGETVTLVRVEGELSLSNVPDADGDGEPGYDIEALEANNAVAVEYYTVTLDGNGEATVPVTLTSSADDSDEAGFNYFVAAHGQASGDMGLASNVVVLKYEEAPANTAPTLDAITDQGVSQSESTSVDVNGSDVDVGDSLTLSVNGPSWVSLADNGDGTGTLTLAPGTSVPVGTYTVEVNASDGQANATEEFAVYVDEPDQNGEVVVAVNAGGGEVTAGDGTVYEADSANQYFTGGSTYSTSQTIDGTDDDTLYQSERYGDFSYEIPVSEEGTYEVTLHYAEVFQGAASQDSPDSTGPNDGTNENDRLFDVAVEGQTVVSSYDIFSEVGPLAATDKTYTVEVTDGTLNVEFSTVNDNAKISAIRVESLDSNQAPTIDAIADQTVTEGETLEVDVNASDADGDAVSLSVSGPGFVTLADAGDGNGTLTIAPSTGANGTYTVEVTADDGTDTTTESFNVTVEPAATGPGPVVGDDAPTDPDGDGLFEDVNGDGSVNAGDAQAIFANAQSEVVQNNVAAFDFNGDGFVNVGDAQALFANGVSAGDA